MSMNQSIFQSLYRQQGKSMHQHYKEQALTTEIATLRKKIHERVVQVEPKMPAPFIRPKRSRAEYHAKRKKETIHLEKMNALLKMFAPDGRAPLYVKYTHHHNRQPRYGIFFSESWPLESGFKSLDEAEEYVHAYIGVDRD